MKRYVAFVAALASIILATVILSRVLDFRVRVLYTDAAVWAMLAGIGLFLLIAQTREDYRIAWRQLRIRRLPLACGGIVSLFVLVGVLDSFHMQRKLPDADAYDTEIVSILDLVLQPLKQGAEKTFSAPLAVRAYTKESIEQASGAVVFDYPRLKFGGAHLADPATATKDIAMRAVAGAVAGALTGAALMGILLVLIPKKAALGVGAFLVAALALIGAVAALAAHYHVLGTDQIGQDVLYRALKGCRTGLIVGTITTLIVTPFALFFGIAAGYFGGIIDDVIQYVYTTMASIPDILLIAAAMLIVMTGLSEEQTLIAADRRLMWLCVILGITGWTELCRLLRAETLKVREIEYVQSAKAFGVRPLKIMLRHIGPNVMHIVLISVMLRFSGLVLFEAVLAYVGIGVDPSTESWGNLVNTARLEMARDPIVWWTLLASFLFMFGLVLPANIFGDAVRDALDPRLRTE